MHAYGHQWVCQLVYNPCIHPGCGLTDGEGVERIWSCIHKLIPITRNQWVRILYIFPQAALNSRQNSRRIWMIDLYMSFINAEGLTNLGTWLERQEAKNVAPRLSQRQEDALGLSRPSA
jgi:hypothetical protein